MASEKLIFICLSSFSLCCCYACAYFCPYVVFNLLFIFSRYILNIPKPKQPIILPEIKIFLPSCQVSRKLLCLGKRNQTINLLYNHKPSLDMYNNNEHITHCIITTHQKRKPSYFLFDVD